MSAPGLRSVILIAVALLLTGLRVPLAAQTQPAARFPAAPSMGQLTRTAGYIFAGTVTSVEPVPPKKADEAGVVRISFRVDWAMRGVRPGQALTIREWAGLWTSGDRYRVGERLALFLYPPSQAGLTSPVGGPWGRFALDRQGQIVLDSARAQALRPLTARGRRLRDPSRISYRDFARAIRRAAGE